MSDATLPGSPVIVRSQRSTHILVFGAVTAVAAAFALALNLHTGLPMPLALGCALVLHLLLFALHLRIAGVQRSARGPARATAKPNGKAAARQAARQAPPAGDIPAAASRRGEGYTGEQPGGPAVQATPQATTRAPQPAPAAEPVPRPSMDRAMPEPVLPRLATGSMPDEPIAVAPNSATAAAFDELLRDLARTLETQPRDGGQSTEPARPTAPSTEDVIAKSVAALRTAGEAMQAYEQRTPAAAAQAPAPRSAPAARAPAAVQAARTPTQAALEEIADAIEYERVEVAVAPIVGLADQRLMHHDMTMRLLTASGGVLVPQGISSVARGTGLVPLLDALKVGRAVRVAQSLESANVAGAVFCRVTGEGLMAKRVVRALAGEPGHVPPAATRVVLMFVQQEIRSFGHAHWSALADLADQGFRFCVSDLVDLDLDIQTLRNVGFMFARSEAGVVLSGLALRGTVIPPKEINRYLGSAGFSLIADQVEGEPVLAALRGCQVTLGQGDLLGRPQTLDLGGQAAA
jgi:EAL domain-containing protein (putative c-di-GMP-specific phosphodiesterase class I)